MNLIKIILFIFIKQVLSTISCIARADWNIIIGFAALAILVRYFDKDPYYFNGILFYLLLASIILDIVWLIFILPAWNDNSPSNKLWNQLSFVHTLVSICSFLEIGVKFLSVFFIMKGFDDSGIKLPSFRFKYLSNEYSE